MLSVAILAGTSRAGFADYPPVDVNKLSPVDLSWNQVGNFEDGAYKINNDS